MGEQVKQPRKVKCEVIKSFYDLKHDELLRNIGDVYEDTRNRINDLVKLGFVKII